MTPLEIRTLFTKKPYLTLTQITDYFQIEASVALMLLKFWQDRVLFTK